MTIRDLAHTDIPALAELAKRSYTDAFGSSLAISDLAHELEHRRSETYFHKAIVADTILVAEHDGTIAGYVQFGLVGIPEAGATAADRELRRLYIDTRLQGKGTGRKLLQAALEHPVMSQAERIFLHVWDNNPRAMALYESVGFRTVGRTDVAGHAKTAGEDLVMARAAEIMSVISK